MQTTYTGLEQLVIPIVESLGYEFIGSERINLDQRSTFRIYIDKEGGINHDDCKKVSSQVEAVLDVEGNFSDPYLLEVSSPGLDRKLFTVEQLKKQIGKEIKLKLNTAIDNCRNFKGILVAVTETGDACTISINSTEVVFMVSNISEARLVPDIKF